MNKNIVILAAVVLLSSLGLALTTGNLDIVYSGNVMTRIGLNDLNAYTGLNTNTLRSLDANNLLIQTSNTTRSTITSSGLVGFNVTPTYAFDVVGSTGVRLTDGTAGKFFFINSGGNIGINTLTPQNALNIVGGDVNISSTGATLYLDGAYVQKNANGDVIITD